MRWHYRATLKAYVDLKQRAWRITTSDNPLLPRYARERAGGNKPLNVNGLVKRFSRYNRARVTTKKKLVLARTLRGAPLLKPA